jgi:MFS family permease
VASKAGIDTDMASTLVSIIGLSTTCGQVVMGYVGDHPRVNTLHFYVAMTTVAGAATLMVPLLLTFIPLAVYCSVYGFFISANYALTTVILVDLLGLDRLTNAFGIVSLAGGVAMLVGPPFAGWLADMSASYDPVFYMAGAVIVLSGMILLSVQCFHQCDYTRSNLSLICDDVTNAARSYLSSEFNSSDVNVTSCQVG